MHSKLPLDGKKATKSIKLCYTGEKVKYTSPSQPMEFK